MSGDLLTAEQLLSLVSNGGAMPPKYVNASPANVPGVAGYRLLDAAHISTGIMDPNRLGTGSTGAGNLYLADDGTWKLISGAPGVGDMLKATYDVDNDGVVDSAERIQILVRNSTGSTLTKGTVVYLSGATGNRPNAVRAQANTEATSSKTFGIVVANINNNADGYVACNGTLHDLDTSAFTAGDALWLSATTAGAYTSTIPSEPNHTVFIGFVARSHPTQGRLVILIQNGYELNELHGVLISAEANNDLLVYETSSTLWKNKSISTIFGGTPLVSVPTLDQVTTAGNTTTNAITVGGLIVDTNVLVVDSVNNRVGINTTTPLYTLDVQGAAAFASPIHIGSVTGALSTSSGALHLALSKLVITSTGNVLINTTTDAGYKLDVNGTARVSGNLTVDTNTLFVDATNDRVGIGTTSPAFRLDVQGTATSHAISTQVGLNFNPVVSPTTGSLALVASAGNVDLGIHYYYVTFTTALGETNPYQIGNITTTSGNQQVTVTIPVSTDSRVTGRKLYRTKASAGGNYWETFNLATIANNTATTYVDNIADASLTGTNGIGFFQVNTTYRALTVNGTQSLVVDQYATYLGVNAGGGVTSGGGNNTFIGYNAGRYSYTSNQSVAIGNSALSAQTAGGNNIGIGSQAGGITTGSNNIVIGRNSGANINTGSENTIIGSFSWNLGTVTGKNNNTGLGYNVGSNNTGNNNLFLGYQAGYLVTGSNQILLDTVGRADEATAKSSALIYGVTNATASSQTLSLGGGGNVMIGTITNAGYKLDVNGTLRTVDSAYFATTSGSVGIGTTSPSAKLHVAGTVQIGTTADASFSFRLTRTSVGVPQDAHFYAPTNNSPAVFYIEGGYYTGEAVGTATAALNGYPYYEKYFGNGSSASYKHLGFINVANGSFGNTNLIPSIALLSTGNVGIGTTSPAYKVDVQGTTLATSSVSVQGAFNINPLAAPPAIGGFTLSAGINLGVGTYYYFVVYVTALGETSAGANLTVVTTTGNTTVNLTGIPVSSDPRVTARKLYRTLVGQTSDAHRFLATISDNVTTTYTDSATDASLTGVALQYYKINTTARYFTVGGVQGMVIDQNLTALGRNAGAAIIASSSAALRTVLIGANAGQNITTGQANVIVGVAGANLTTGGNNALFGDIAGYNLTTGYDNTILGGDGAGRWLTTSTQNVIIGAQAARNLADGTTQFTGGSNNTVIGVRARMSTISDTNSIIIGHTALGLGSNTTVIGNSSTTFTSIPAGNMTIGGPTNAGYKLDVIGNTRVAGVIEVGANTAVQGGPSLYQKYTSSTNIIGSMSTEYSSGAMILGYGAVGKTGVAGYVSSFDNFSAFRSAIKIGQLTAFTVLGTTSAVATTVGSDLTMNTLFQINNAGNVGIGSSNPTQKLDVVGSAKIRGATFFGAISQPSLPTLTTNSPTGGTLAAATYYYRIVAVDFFGNTTTPSNELAVTTTGTTSSITLSWPLVQGAYQYRIYRGTTSGGQNTYYTLSGTNATSFTDTGAAGTAGTTPAENLTSYGYYNSNGDFRSGNILIVNNGVGNTSSIIFDKSTDGPQINVTEYVNDGTLFEFALRDNPDGPDAFHFVMPDWQNPSSGWKPFKFAAFTTQIVGQNTNFWSSFSLPSSTPYFTTNPESIANSQIKWDPYTSTSYNLLRDNGTGTGNLNVDVTGFNGTTNTIYWVTIASPTTFNWGLGWSGGTASGTGVTITGGWQVLGNGIQIKLTGTFVANDRWAFRAFPVPKMGIGTTTPTAPLQVSTTIAAVSGTARGVYFNPTVVATANSDSLIALDIVPTFTTGAFTGVKSVALRTQTGDVYLTTTSGSVGIGTSAPTSRLHVAGRVEVDNGFNLESRTSAGSNLVCLIGMASNAINVGVWEGNYMDNLFLRGGNGSVYTDFSQGNNRFFAVRGVAGSTPTEYMRVNHLGNLLIGTTTDSGHRLNVNGNAKIQGSITATLANTVTSSMVYYNSSTGLLTYGALPAPTAFQIDYDYNIVGIKNGVNVVFTTSANFVLTTTRVYLNGQRLTRGVGYDYVETGTNQVTFANPLNPTDQIIIEYQL